MSDEDDIILADLDDDELVQQMHDDLYDGLQDEIREGVEILLERGWTPYDVLTKALVEGMTIVGIDFRDGILFVPEVLMAANAMKSGMTILRPLLAETGAPKVGSMVIGTVKGDIHDIGKNLVSMMLEGAGFDVVDIGINNPVENYLEALEEHKPDILGMSALLTTTMPYMKVVIDAMVEKGIRDDYIVLVGGAPLNEAFAESVGADAYCRDAAVAVETAKEMVAAKRGKKPQLDKTGNPSSPRRVDRLSPVVRWRVNCLPSPQLPAGTVELTCLPASWHNHPERIVPGLRRKVAARAVRVAMSPLSMVTAVLAANWTRFSSVRRLTRIPGPHCYEMFLGHDVFADEMERELGTFFLTDYMVRHFERIVMQGMGLRNIPSFATCILGITNAPYI